MGFVHLSNIDERFQALEKLAAGGKGVPELATYILVVMVRGVTTSLCFPYAHFATSGVTAKILSSLDVGSGSPDRDGRSACHWNDSRRHVIKQKIFSKFF